MKNTRIIYVHYRNIGCCIMAYEDRVCGGVSLGGGVLGMVSPVGGRLSECDCGQEGRTCFQQKRNITDQNKTKQQQNKIRHARAMLAVMFVKMSSLILDSLLGLQTKSCSYVKSYFATFDLC